MLRNYLIISFRKFTRQKFYSLLNIFGLATGMATVILIMLYVRDEVGYDDFHRYKEDIYRVVENQYYSGQPVFPVAVTPGPLAAALKADFPEVELATRVHYGWNAFQYKESKLDDAGVYVDQDFFRMFDFTLTHGDTATALKEINSMLVTGKLAKKLFGDENPLGKTVTVNHDREVIVTGVLEDIPANSHLQFSYVMPMARRLIEIPSLLDQWGSNSLYTYVKLVKGASASHLNEQIAGYIKKKNKGSVTEIYLQPLGDIHLGEVAFVADVNGKGNIQYVRIFSVVAVFILLIACINFMNLATARAMKRAKEVGLRKTVGAFRYQLILQFLGESVIVASVAMLVALLFVDLLLPAFNTLTQKSLTIDYSNPIRGVLPFCAAATLLTGLLAGSYPAIFLSSFRPAQVLKGSATDHVSGGTFRKILVVLQFSISIVMITGTMVIYSQVRYIRNKNLGWDRDNLLLVHNASNYPVLKKKLLSYPDIKSISASNQDPNLVQNSTTGIGWKGKNEDDAVLFHVQGVDYDYIETMKMQMLMGRSFSEASAGDSSSVVINEQAMNVLGFKNPIGEHLTAGEDEVHTIIGVVKDFHFKTVHDKIEPLLLYIERKTLSNMIVRIEGNAEKAVGEIDKEWKAVNPDQLLSYSFADDEFDNLYRSEQRTGTIFEYFAALAVVISCLGLFGLASYTVDQKSREYGIRKVFGASVSRLFYLASVEFLVLVILAFIISIPLAWVWMRHWLSTFAYHIELSWMFFIASGMVAVGIALITVTYQSGKVGWINPASVLRSE
ncbi:MAG TPA: ABC transporter permease [Chryseosolibacter sp.]|nr:ABC transporter permease [Chryseosolibacter sp.]